DVSGTLATGNDQTIFCRASGQANAETCEGVAPTLAARQHRDPPILGDDMVVRRLTPTECERLQGFPDGWTDVPYRGKEYPADTPRYKAIGNSMAVPVMRWIGRRIAAYELLEGGES
ncbi:DNA cytosine methyltransferase, partial [Olsenella uli]|uniref:DNA cytosine methyltransferase n=1 Tax=Olsenella uli TaxID=133926 RepID=UPI0028ED2D5F